MTKLTASQHACLQAAEYRTMRDNSGDGYAMYDRVQLRVAERLKAKGFVTITMPTRGAPFGFVRITDAGRKALSSDTEKDL